MKVVQQLTYLRQSQWSDLTLDCPNGPTYSTGELLNTPLVGHCVLSLAVICVVWLLQVSQLASLPSIIIIISGHRVTGESGGVPGASKQSRNSFLDTGSPQVSWTMGRKMVDVDDVYVY